MTTILHDGLREEIVHSGLVWFGVICSRVVLKLVIIQRGGVVIMRLESLP